MTKAEIEGICEMYNINDYQINDDGTVDVNGNVYLAHQKLNKLPLKFGIIFGRFDCSYNLLENLEGCPNEVYSELNASHNNLNTLFYFPKAVYQDILLDFNKLPKIYLTAIGKDLIVYGTDELDYEDSDYSKLATLLLYQSYYEVWLPEFNLENFKGLIEDIHDGLK